MKRKDPGALSLGVVCAITGGVQRPGGNPTDDGAPPRSLGRRAYPAGKKKRIGQQRLGVERDPHGDSAQHHEPLEQGGQVRSRAA